MISSRARATAFGVVLSTLLAAGLLAAGPASAAPIGTSQAFAVTGAVQTWTVPAGVTSIYVEMAGGQGGRSYGWGGTGAELTGTLAVTPGTTLNIIVGGLGADGVQFSRGAGGGGGSFVYTAATTAGMLAVAGGGGGNGSNDFATTATLTTSGNPGNQGGGAGGVAGSGGGGAGGAGGGGILTSGGGGNGGGSVVSGAAGGSGTSRGAYGGGGGTSTSPGGGGGGYSGGGGGAFPGSTAGGGGGGGSYFSGTLATSATGNWGAGYVRIYFAPMVTSVTPASVPQGSAPTVAITGTNFTAATGVFFDGTAASSFIVNSATSITAFVPASLPAGVAHTTVSTAVSASGTSSADQLEIVAYPPMTISATTVTDGSVGVAYSRTFTAAGGTAPYSYALASGVLPTGLALGSSSGILSGTPTASGSFTFSIAATDQFGNTQTESFSLTVAAAAALAATGTHIESTLVAAGLLLLLGLGALALGVRRRGRGSLPTA